MTNTFWRRVSYLFGLAAISVLFGLVVFSANIEIKDLDLWLHLKMGEYILQHCTVPAVDVLSCSIAGQPWTNHEWLFQVIAYFIFSHWGADGLISMQVFVVSATFLILLLLGYSKDRQLGIVFILLLVMLVYQQRFTIRPDIFSLLFFASYIYILSLHVDKKWSIYALGFIQVLWANFHGFFFFGPFIILVGIFSEFLKRRVRLPWQWGKTGHLTNEEYKRLKIILAVVILASLVNPLGAKGAWYPLGVLTNLAGESKIFFKHIQELKAPLSLGTIFSVSEHTNYKLLIVLSCMGFIFNRRKIDIGDLFIWLIFLSFSLVAIRNLVFFSFVAYLTCVTNFTNIKTAEIVPLYFKDKKFEHITVALFKLILILWMINYGFELSQRTYFDFDKYELKSEFGGITQRSYPNKAADFLVANHVKGNFFNDFNSGAYLIGRCFPDIKVFIDGRTEVYGAKFFKNYQKIWKEGNKEAFDEAVNRYHITGALLNSVYEPISDKTLSLFYGDKTWVVVYFDYDAVIFLKDIPENAIIIDKHRIDLSRWKTKEMDLRELGSKRVTPYQPINRAYTLESLGLDDAALQEVNEALKVAPAYAEPYKLYGKIFGKKNDYQKAFENFRIAATMSPDDVETRFNLGLAYEKLSDFPHAIRQYQAVTRYAPKNPRGYFVLSKAYAKDKQYGEALKALAKAHRLDSSVSSDVVEIGDVIFADKEFDFARQAYVLALEAKKDLGKIHNKIGMCYREMGQNDSALKEFQEGLSIDPSNSELKENIEAISRFQKK